MQHTTELGLNKPELTDYRDITKLNENMDTLEDGVVLRFQGTANAGKFMVVNSSGYIAPVTVPFALGVSF